MPLVAALSVADERAFHQELRARNFPAFRWIAAVFNVFYVAWTFFDRALLPAYAERFLHYRLAASGLNTLLLVAVVARWRSRTWEAFSLWICTFAAFTALMLPPAGILVVEYAAGYALILIGPVMCLWPPRWHVPTIATMALMPVATLGAAGRLGQSQSLAALFVILTAAAISSLATTFRYTSSRREYVMRAELASALRRESETRARLEFAHTELRRAGERAVVGRMSGQVVADRYMLDELLGRGGMGEVYSASRLDGDGKVAVKVLLAHLEDEPEVRARFRREAEVVQRLPRDLVAPVVEFGVTADGLEFIVMELLRTSARACAASSACRCVMWSRSPIAWPRR
jgi:hypothetical protein